MTTTRHLSDEELLDAVEATAGASARAHLDACASCRGRRDDAREALLLVREAEVPEPSPLYWDAFRRQVGRRIADDRPPARAWLLPLAAAAAAVLFVVPLLRNAVPTGSGPGAPPLPAWSPLPEGDEDEGLALVAESGVAEADLAAVGEMKGLDEVLGELSEEEQSAVGNLLRTRASGDVS